MPLLLFSIQAVFRFFKNDSEFNLSLPMVVTATIYVSIVFEWYLPERNKLYTADAIDIIMYVIGSSIYCLTKNKLNSYPKLSESKA